MQEQAGTRVTMHQELTGIRDRLHHMEKDIDMLREHVLIGNLIAKGKR